MATSALQYIVDAMVDALQSDGSLTVRRIWRPDAYESTTTIVYPYVSSMQYDSDAETGQALGLGRAACEIMCNAMVESDASQTGIATERAGEIVTAVKYALESYDLDAIGTHDDGRYQCRIVNIHVDGNVGNFNIGANKVQMGVAATVTFVIQPTS